MTDEQKPCLAYPCDGHMEENNYDASLECASCQFVVADELEYSALAAGRQAAIDAALESVAVELLRIAVSMRSVNLESALNYDPEITAYRKAASLLRSRIGTNPLADLQQKNLELARHNMELRDRVTELERDAYDMACRQCIIQDGLLGDERGNPYCRLERERDEARKDALDAKRYRRVRTNPAMLLHLSNKDFDEAIDAAIAAAEAPLKD